MELCPTPGRWQKGIVQSDTKTNPSAIVVKSGLKYFILPENRFWPGLKHLKTGWEIYFQADGEEIIEVFMYGKAGIEKYFKPEVEK